jgi:hypothetical protein
MCSVKVGQARSTAFTWVMRHACRARGFLGAYFGGYATQLPDDARLPAGAEVAVNVVIGEAGQLPASGAFVYHDVLLKVRYLPWDRVASASDVIGSYRLAADLSTDTIILDPTGYLGRLHDLVALDFTKQIWVRRRYSDARATIELGLRNLDVTVPFAQQVSAWLSSMGAIAQVLLVAALRNPGGWLRFVTAREVLDEYGHDEFHLELLDLLRCVHLPRRRVEYHVQALVRTFDTIVAEVGDEYFPVLGIAAEAVPIMVDGVRDLIERGHHRESMPWMVTTLARCQSAMLASTAPDRLRRIHGPAAVAAYEATLSDLSITSTNDLLGRTDEVLAFLPRLWWVTEKILGANRRIELA